MEDADHGGVRAEHEHGGDCQADYYGMNVQDGCFRSGREAPICIAVQVGAELSSPLEAFDKVADLRK